MPVRQDGLAAVHVNGKRLLHADGRNRPGQFIDMRLIVRVAHVAAVPAVFDGDVVGVEAKKVAAISGQRLQAAGFAFSFGLKGLRCGAGRGGVGGKIERHGVGFLAGVCSRSVCARFGRLSQY